MEDKI